MFTAASLTQLSKALPRIREVGVEPEKKSLHNKNKVTFPPQNSHSREGPNQQTNEHTNKTNSIIKQISSMRFKYLRHTVEIPL